MQIQILKKAYLGLAFTILLLICLGGAVRALDAGLACPDWPLCFGDIIPDFHPQVFLEFIHRAIAGLEALVSFYFGFLILKSTELKKSTKRVVLLGWAILIIQILMGALTVLKLLQSSVVVLHLAFGLAFFCSLLWIYFDLSNYPEKKWTRSKAFFIASLLALLFLSIQVLLGGYVATSYSGLACMDFPTCNELWFPPMIGKVGIQMMHRFGAYFCFVFVFCYSIYAKKLFNKEQLSFESFKNARFLMSLLLVQIALGIANVKFLIPPLITVLHLLVASAILGLCLRNIYLNIPKGNSK